MFTSYDRLVKKSGKKGVDRREYLKELVEEFQRNSSKECKVQILANLSNFAYDPINYTWFKELKIIDLFLDELEEDTQGSDLKLKSFALAGLCNVVVDEVAKEYVIRRGGASSIVSFLECEDDCCILSALTTLMFLFAPSSVEGLICDSLKIKLNKLSQSDNKRVKNLANLFLLDYFPQHPSLKS